MPALATGFVLPFVQGTVVLTNDYGETGGLTDFPTFRHLGEDWAGPIGTTILAVANGKVVETGHNGSFGNYIIIEHTLPSSKVVYSLYAHLNSVSVTDNDDVTIGSPIGTLGATGAADGAHLHWEMSYVNKFLQAGPYGKGYDSPTEFQKTSKDTVDPSDFVAAHPRTNLQEGSSGHDTLLGGNGDDGINGKGGNDSVQGLGGDDTLAGGAGNDFLAGGLGDNRLEGGGGNDTVVSGTGPVGGSSWIDGGGGDDALLATSPGNDTVLGGAGNDTIGAGFGGRNLLVGGAGDDLLTGTGDDRMFGDAGNDILRDVGSGASSLHGGDGADTITGGSGNNTINGGTGADQLTGGPGADLFQFDSGRGGPLSFDTIMDWASADALEIVGLAQGGLFNYLEATASTFSEARSIANTAVRFGLDYVAVAVGGDVYVFADSGDNNGSAETTILLQGASLHDISSSSFF